MDEILALLIADPAKALAVLKSHEVNPDEVTALHKEYNDVDRLQRDTQIGTVQKPKQIGKGSSTRYVKKVNIPIPFQNRIVRTATAFEVGEPPSLIPEERNDLSDEILRLWKVNRLDAILQKAKILQKSEKQCAISFYLRPTNPLQAKGPNTKWQIKSRLLENENGRMAPYFDEFGDMLAFVWEFDVKEGDATKTYAWVYTDKFIYKLGPTDAAPMSLIEFKPHGFQNIPIVYLHQERPEWHEVQEMIDRLEVALSRLGDANDYTGHPILKIYGEVLGAPEKGEEGKAFVIPKKFNQETQQMETGEVEFLTFDQAPEAVRMEIDRLEKYIYSMTSTPDISFENLKGMGGVSGVAIKLMFLDAILKAKMNEGENRTIIERINNVLISGTVKTIATSWAPLARQTFINVQFNSVIPEDLKDSVETLRKAVEGKFMSRKKAVEVINMADDYEAEMEQIDLETKGSQIDPQNDPDEEIQPTE